LLKVSGGLMATQQLILVLQTSVAPCVIISGVGLLVLSMTNRLGDPLIGSVF
jgi:hypothetical protein